MASSFAPGGSRVEVRTAEEVLRRVGSCQEVVERHGGDVRRGMAKCILPGHDDRTASLHVFQGRDGKSRFYCHGCGRGGDAIDLARTLGEMIEWGAGRRSKPYPHASKPKEPSRRQKELTAFLSQREPLHFELEAAASLARIHEAAASLEVDRNRTFLETDGSLVLILELADRLRSWLFEAYGIPHGFVWPKEVVREALGLPS